jgi:hypothetical protein
MEVSNGVHIRYPPSRGLGQPSDSVEPYSVNAIRTGRESPPLMKSPEPSYKPCRFALPSSSVAYTSLGTSLVRSSKHLIYGMGPFPRLALPTFHWSARIILCDSWVGHRDMPFGVTANSRVHFAFLLTLCHPNSVQDSRAGFSRRISNLVLKSRNEIPLRVSWLPLQPPAQV